MGLYTIEKLREVARSKDTRLNNKTTYPDSWIDDKIEHAFETAESGRQVFTNEEIVDLTQYVQGNVEKLQLTMDEEVHSFYDITVSHEHSIRGTVNNDNTVSIVLDIDKLKDITNPAITLRYFYYPRIGFTSMFMKPETFHFFRHCLYVNIYGSLRDKENETYHQEQVDRFIADGSFGIPNDFDRETPMKGSFDIRPTAI